MSVELVKSRLSMGPSRATLYQLDLPRDDDNRKVGVTREVKQYLQYFARDLNIPAVSHEILPVIGQSYMGVTRLQPTAMKFVGNQFMISVIENSQFTVYEDLRNLFNNVGQNFNPDASSSRTQRQNFYDDYVFDVVIKKLEFPDMKQLADYVDDKSADSGYRIVAKFTFNRCYVSKMGDINLSSEAFNGMTTFDITFNYETYEYQYLGADKENAYSHMDKR